MPTPIPPPSHVRPAHTTVRRKRSSFLLAALLLLALGVLSACESTNAAINEVLALTNRSRSEAGVGALQRNVQLEVKADAWARHMRDTCDISHSVLIDGAPDDWYKLGENVGRGRSIDEVHGAFLQSPGHLANVVDPSYTAVGSAAVWGECNGYRMVFVATVFMQPLRP